MNRFPYADVAHRTAIEKGFYDQGHDQSIVATKLALIQTEIDEAHDAYHGVPDDSGKVSNLQEELADIIIRAADLAGYLENHDAGYFDVTPSIMESSSEMTIDQLFFRMMKYTAKAVQMDRKELDDRVRNSKLRAMLYNLVFDVDDISRTVQKDYSANTTLKAAVERKLESNTDRPRYHGRRY